MPASRLHTSSRLVPSALALLAVVAPAAHAQRPAPVSSKTLEVREVRAPDTTLMRRVGSSELVSELRVPSGPGPHPLAVVIHGGCWLTKFADTRYMRPMAEALRDAGIATWTIAYRRADEAGGGWPGTFQDVAASTAQVRTLARRYALDLDHVVATGHSAGAHLALWLAAQPKLPAESGVRATADVLPIRAVVALDGPGDLAAANVGVTPICGSNVLEQLLGSTPQEQPERWSWASPSSWLPLGVPQVMVRGGLDAQLPRLGAKAGDMTTYAARARQAGDNTWVVNADTTSHFKMLDPKDPAFTELKKAMLDAFATIGRPVERK